MSKTEIAKSKTRYNGRWKKRQWEENDRNSEQAEQAKRVCNGDDDEPFVRIKKRKSVLLLGYCGMDYWGMQKNPNVKTIEGDLHSALLQSKYVSQLDFDQMQNVAFQRAARTDKGVSAARQIVSMKLPEEVDVSKINEHLPPSIKVFAAKRVTKGFDAKTNCDARTYTYMLPTYSFEKRDVSIENHKDYRTPPERIAKLNEILKIFLGTHNFHNFTSKKPYVDPSAKRFILSFECGEPFVASGMEFAVIKIKGQSFMMHQIRKMVGLCLAILKGYTSEDIVQKSFGPDRFDMPMAPGLGLMLDQMHYDRYDVRYGKDGVHETIEKAWKDVEEEVVAFREKHIFPSVVNEEISEMPMASWLETLSNHSYAVRTEKDPKKVEDVDQEPDSDDDDENTLETDEVEKVKN